MKVLMVSTECYPYAKAGGLGDVVWSLSEALSQLGVELKVLIPRYYNIDKSKLTSWNIPLGVPSGDGEFWCGLFSKKINKNLEILFLDNESLYGRHGIYGPSSSTSFLDNFLRFSILSRSAFQVSLALGWIPNIIHSHDWATALTTLYLKRLNIPEFYKTKSVFSIHNIGYQGLFPQSDFYKTGLPESSIYDSGIESFSNLNLMQLGIVQCDFLTTVSPTYASEIQRQEYGEGIDSIIRHHSYKLRGILNGVDYDTWDPKEDKFIKKQYTIKTIADKEENKKDLLKEFDLHNKNKPVIGIVSRLVSQKGFGELCGPLYGCLYSICEVLGVQVVIIGTGEEWVENELRSLNSTCSNLSVKITYNESLSHTLIAGSDFLLVPSLYEPCGLTQMYALKYGTIPIVSELGGLYDTVENWDSKNKTGDGFYIHHPINPHNIFHAVNRATRTWWDDKKAIDTMKKNAMEKIFLWCDFAKEYKLIYNECIQN